MVSRRSTPISDLIHQTGPDCGVERPGSAIEQLIEPVITDLGDFSVRRVLPNAARRMVGPWVFFDHMGPADFPAGQGVNVRPHPHINLATVTYLFEGEILHRDSLGNAQLILPGEINLMVAGRGIVHSERERPEVRAVPHRAHALQLWLALPEADEETEPSFGHYSGAEIPARSVDGVPVRILMGSAFGAVSPVPTFADTLYLEAELAAGQRLVLPEKTERAVYVVQGAVEACKTKIPAHTMAVFATQAKIELAAVSAARVVVIGGESPGRRYMDWNFISSRRERIRQAREDWREGRFPKVPGDELEFIPLP